MAYNGGIQLSLMIGSVVPEPVPKEVISCLTGVQVRSSATRQGGFQCTFTAGKESMIMHELLPGGYFDAPRRVVITVTLAGETTVIMDGIISRYELSVSSEPGATTLTVTGLDISEIMNRLDLSGFPWPAMPPFARISVAIAKYAMYGIVPKVIPSVLMAAPNPLERIDTQRGTDLQYIRRLAREAGYIFNVQPGPAPGMSVAYWGPQIKTGVPQPALSVNMDAHTNVESMSLSFDGLKKTLFTFFIQQEQGKFPIPIPVPDITPLNPPLGAKYPPPLSYTKLDTYTPEDLDDTTAKFDAVTAAARGLARASEASDVVAGSGTLDVPRYGHVLLAGKLVAVRGAGRAFDGHYYVSSVTHTIKAGDYKQGFQLTRNALISLSSEVDV
ncbi:MAG: hypothetical protein GY703_12185 [Gammaproteobacteria bacterium]|nr:hypothetical protein [Gammaproteobacteria bacterium]